MVANPELLSGMGVTDQIRDNSDYPHSGLYKAFNSYASGSYATTGFDITQSASGGYTRFTLTDGAIFRNGGYVSIAPATKHVTLTSSNAPHATYTYYLLLVVDSSNAYQLRGASSTLAVTNARTADLTTGDIPIAVIQITAGTANDVTNRNLQYLTVRQRTRDFSYGIESSNVFEELISLNESSGDVTLATLKQDKDLIFTVNDNASTNEVMRLDGSESALSLVSTRKLMFGGTGRYLVDDGSNLFAYSDGDITLDVTGNDIKFATGGSGLFPLFFSHANSGDWIIGNQTSNKDLTFQVKDGSSLVTAMKIKTDATDINSGALGPSVSIGANDPQAELHVNALTTEVIIDSLGPDQTDQSTLQFKRSQQNLSFSSLGQILFNQFKYTSATQHTYAKISAQSLSYGTSNTENQRGYLEMVAYGLVGTTATDAHITLAGSNASSAGAITINAGNNSIPTTIKSAGNDSALVVTGGKVGVSTSAPDTALEVNANDAPQLRLTFNDNDGSATNKADFTQQATGELLIHPSGEALVIRGSVGGRALSEVSAIDPSLSTDESGKVVFMTNPSPIACTLPNCNTEVGLQFVIQQVGAGTVTITAGTNSSTGAAQTINGSATKATTAQYDAVTVIYVGSNTWNAIG